MNVFDPLTPQEIETAMKVVDSYEQALEAVRTLLLWVHEDPDREGLQATPDRVLRALTEMTKGQAEDPADLLATTFDETSDQLVVVSGIEFVSMCEHHLLPFTGVATVGYLPGERVVGLSKLARVVDAFAQRLQVQERMTQEIATAIYEHLDARAAGVVLRATHHCMSCRGVRKRAQMVTSCLLGLLRDEPALRAEFLALERS